MKHRTIPTATMALLLALMVTTPTMATETPTEPVLQGQRGEQRQDGSRMSAEQRAERREQMRAMNREERREFMQQRSETRQMRREQRQQHRMM